MPKPEPPAPRWWVRAGWWLWATVTWWPWTVRQLQAQGYTRTGWRTWEWRPDA